MISIPPEKTTSPATVEILERKPGYQGFYRMDCIRFRHRLFSGEMGPVLNRELLVRRDAVCVLPYDPQSDKVVLIEQFRIGAMDKTANPWLLEMIAGLIDHPEEAPEQVALREAREEAGLDITELWPISNYFSSPGGSNEYMYLYLGRCNAEHAGGIHGLEEEGEDIRVHVLTFSQALQALQQGRIINASAIIGLQWLALNRQIVRAQWK